MIFGVCVCVGVWECVCANAWKCVCEREMCVRINYCIFIVCAELCVC